MNRKSCNSSIIISGEKGTSTPIDLVRSRNIDFNCNNINYVKKKLDFLHPKVQYADVPIFGRRRLEMLSELAYANKPIPELEPKSPVMAEDISAIAMAVEPMAEGTNPDKKSKKKIMKNPLFDRAKKTTTKIENKKSSGTNKKIGLASQSQVQKPVSTANNLKNRRSILPKNLISATVKRKPVLKQPSFKASPKCIKSPRYLRTIREKVKKLRERKGMELREDEQLKIASKQNSTDNEIGLSPITKRSEVYVRPSNEQSTELEMKKKVPVSKHMTESEKKKTKDNKPVLLPSSINIRKRKTETKKKICQSGTTLKCAMDLLKKEVNYQDLEKLVVFRTGSIKTYSPAKTPNKNHEITVPESLKLRKHRSRSC